MALRNENEWTEFLESAGITDGTILTTYSKAFTDNGFNEHSLTVLDKDSLTAIGITLLGHQLAILKFAAERQQQSARPTTTKASVTARLSTLTLEMTCPQFRKFRQDWTVYKQITNLAQSQATAHLYNACDDEVQIRNS